MLCISLQRFAQHDSGIIRRHSRSGNHNLHAAGEANNGKRQQKATKITKHFREFHKLISSSPFVSFCLEFLNGSSFSSLPFVKSICTVPRGTNSESFRRCDSTINYQLLVRRSRPLRRRSCEGCIGEGGSAFPELMAEAVASGAAWASVLVLVRL